MDVHVGQLLVVPGCGVGRVAAVQTMDLDGAEVEFCRLDMADGETRMWVPTARVLEDGIRPVMSKGRMQETLQVLGHQEAEEKRGNWNRRRRHYEEVLRSNDPDLMAEVVGEMASALETKPLAYGERRLYERMRKLLAAEIAAVFDEPLPAAERRMDESIEAH